MKNSHKYSLKELNTLLENRLIYQTSSPKTPSTTTPAPAPITPEPVAPTTGAPEGETPLVREAREAGAAVAQARQQLDALAGPREGVESSTIDGMFNKLKGSIAAFLPKIIEKIEQLLESMKKMIGVAGSASATAGKVSVDNPTTAPGKVAVEIFQEATAELDLLRFANVLAGSDLNPRSKLAAGCNPKIIVVSKFADLSFTDDDKAGLTKMAEAVIDDEGNFIDLALVGYNAADIPKIKIVLLKLKFKDKFKDREDVKKLNLDASFIARIEAL